MWKTRSPPKTVNMPPPGGLCGSQQRGDDNSESPDNSSQHATRKYFQFGKHTNQYHPPQGYGCPPSKQPFPGALQLYHQSPFNVTHSSQPTCSASPGFSSHGPLWEGYNLHQHGYGGSQMFPPAKFPERVPWSPGTPRVLLGPPGNHPVNRPTSSSSTPPPQPPSGAPGKHPFSLPLRRFQPPVEPQTTDIQGIADSPPLPEMS